MKHERESNRKIELILSVVNNNEYLGFPVNLYPLYYMLLHVVC